MTGLLRLTLSLMFGFAGFSANAADLGKAVDSGKKVAQVTCKERNASCADSVKAAVSKNVSIPKGCALDDAKFGLVLGQLRNKEARKISANISGTCPNDQTANFIFGLSCGDFGCDWSVGAEHPGCGWVCHITVFGIALK